MNTSQSEHMRLAKNNSTRIIIFMTLLTHEPKQARSRRTLAALVEAAEALLETKAFAALSVQEIAARAGCTTGSFYARFTAKEDLLPYLYERYDEAHTARLEGLVASPDWQGRTLEQVLDATVSETISAYAARPHLLREIALFVRRDPGNTPPEGVERRRRVQQAALELIAGKANGRGERVGLPSAAFVLTVIGNMVREAVLFGDAPLSRATAVPHTDLRRRLVKLALAYLDSADRD
jgi:AcrR family transcriptional regulator